MNRDLKVLIVEDEYDCRDVIINHISSIPRIRNYDIAENGSEALKKLNKNKYDIVYLDVELPDQSGIDVFEKASNTPKPIFTTAHEKYAVKAFKLDAIDYLVKPIYLNDFKRATAKAIFQIDMGRCNETKITRSLKVKDGKKTRLIPHEDIVYLSAHGEKTVIHTDQEDFEAYKLLKSYEVLLPSNTFIRISKTIILNHNFISDYGHEKNGQYFVTLDDDDDNRFIIGKNYVPLFKKIVS